MARKTRGHRPRLDSLILISANCAIPLLSSGATDYPLLVAVSSGRNRQREHGLSRVFASGFWKVLKLPNEIQFVSSARREPGGFSASERTSMRAVRGGSHFRYPGESLRYCES